MKQLKSPYTYSPGTMVGSGGSELYFQKWETEPSSAALIIVHGLGEHSGRYQNLIDACRGMGVSLYSYDHRGHGRSGGKRGHISSFKNYIDDLDIFVNHVRLISEKKPLILLGHSMGGLIALQYALDYPKNISGLILSSPFLMAQPPSSLLDRTLLTVVNKIYPSLSLSNRIDVNGLSHNKKVIQDYVKDPLVHNRITVRFAAEAFKTTITCRDRLPELKMPVLVFHGTGDTITNPRGSQLIYDRAKSKDKSLELFNGLYHETMNELKNRDVLQTVVMWIQKRYLKRPASKKKIAATKKSAKKKAKSKS